MTLPKPVRLGSSGLKISPIIVGCMSYGSKEWAPWVLDNEEEIFKVLKHCYDNGLRTFDTADFYSNGLSERLVGKFLKRYNINRETVVILTKVFFPVDETLDLSHSKGMDEATQLAVANQQGLSRKHILDGVAKSVERLGTYIDVLQIHRFDTETPVNETMKALNDVVSKGYTRYIGASSMLATQFAELQFVAEKHDWFKFISSQSCYNLLYREDERELIPFAKRHNIGLIPWSPNARGVLTRPLGTQTLRHSTDFGLKRISAFDLQPHEEEIVRRVGEIAEKRGVTMAVVSIAWVLSKGCYPIVGLSSTERVDETIKAAEFKLTEEEATYLEEPYKPRAYLS